MHKNVQCEKNRCFSVEKMDAEKILKALRLINGVLGDLEFVFTSLLFLTYLALYERLIKLI